MSHSKRNPDETEHLESTRRDFQTTGRTPGWLWWLNPLNNIIDMARNMNWALDPRQPRPRKATATTQMAPATTSTDSHQEEEV